MKPCAATIRGALTKSWIAFCPPRLRSRGALKERMMPRWLLLRPYSDVKLNGTGYISVYPKRDCACV